VLEGGVDERAQARPDAAAVTAEIADDPVELTLADRLELRGRHARGLGIQVVQRAGARVRGEAVPLVRIGAGYAGRREQGELAGQRSRA
jgi:hypothetical protein